MFTMLPSPSKATTLSINDCHLWLARVLAQSQTVARTTRDGQCTGLAVMAMSQLKLEDDSS